MTKIALLLLASIFCLTLTASAQQNENPKQKGQIGITFSTFGNSFLARNDPWPGEPSNNGDQHYSLGINYIYRINNVLGIESGIEYNNYKIIVSTYYDPSMETTSHNTQLSLVTFPVSLRADFAKYFFVNAGLYFDINPSASSEFDKQGVIGAMAGAGINYDFKIGLSAFVNPYAKAHSLTPFSSFDSLQRLMESGIRFGLMYKLK